MKKIVKLTFVVGAFIVVVVILAVLLMSYFDEAHLYSPKPVYSVDGARVIIPTIIFNKETLDTYLLVHIEVQDVKYGETLFQVQTRASSRMNWSVDWVDTDTIILNSSDIGSYCWTESINGKWIEVNCP